MRSPLALAQPSLLQLTQDLQDITQLADLNILMATHSPDIIQDRWDLTVELKGPQK